MNNNNPYNPYNQREEEITEIDVDAMSDISAGTSSQSNAKSLSAGDGDGDDLNINVNQARNHSNRSSNHNHDNVDIDDTGGIEVECEVDQEGIHIHEHSNAPLPVVIMEEPSNSCPSSPHNSNSTRNSDINSSNNSNAASIILGDKGIRSSSARSRASSNDESLRNEPLTRLIRGNNTWAHRDQDHLSNQPYYAARHVGPTNWNHVSMGLPRNMRPNHNNNYNPPPTTNNNPYPGNSRRNADSHRRSNSHTSSSFSPLSYVNESDHIESLSQLQNEALGSWLRLRPRESTQSAYHQSQSQLHSHAPQAYSGNRYIGHRGSSFQQQHNQHQHPAYGRVSYPISMVNDTLDASHRFMTDEEYEYVFKQEQIRRNSNASAYTNQNSNASVHTDRNNSKGHNSHCHNSKSSKSNCHNSKSSKSRSLSIEQNEADFVQHKSFENKLQQQRANLEGVEDDNVDNKNNNDEEAGFTISFPSEIENLDDGMHNNGSMHNNIEKKDKDEINEDDKNNSNLNPSYEHSSNPGSSQNANKIHWASPDSKYEKYIVRVDRQQGDRASEITLFSLQRPHMRGFHFAWFSFFVCFFLWFAISPLLREIQNSLGLNRDQIWISNTYSSAGTIFFRLLAGPLCDTYGARLTMAFCLVLTAIPVMLIGIVHNATELYIIRLFTGISGSSFVICQYWTSSMFVREIAGTANSLASGWGNLGGGVAQIVIGSALFPLFKVIYGKESQDYAWRTIFIAPAICGIITAICLMKYSDDTPKGNYRKMHRLGTAPVPKIMKSFRLASFNMNTWILFIQYACCFGVEVTMTTGAAFYFSDAFDQTTESAAALASIFGWLNLFARGLGGFISDIMNVKFGMRGRLLWQVVSLVFEGALIICFGYAKTLAGSISTMIAFSLFVQTSEGSTYSIVPYVCPRATGSVAGIVGAGGNVGGVIFLFLITKLDYEKSFFYMGLTVIACSLLSFYINIAGYSRGLRKMDNVREVDIADGSDHDINGDEKEKSTNFETSGNAHTTSDTEQIRNETIP